MGAGGLSAESNVLMIEIVQVLAGETRHFPFPFLFNKILIPLVPVEGKQQTESIIINSLCEGVPGGVGVKRKFVPSLLKLVHHNRDHEK